MTSPSRELVFAIDPGLEVTGYAAVDVRGVNPLSPRADEAWPALARRLVDAGTIKGSASRKLERRISKATLACRQTLISLLDQDTLRAVVIEVPAWAGMYNRRRNPKAVESLNRYIGALYYAFSLQGDTHFMPASKTPKERRLDWVQTCLRKADFKEITEQNTIDAIYLALDWCFRTLAPPPRQEKKA